VPRSRAAEPGRRQTAWIGRTRIPRTPGRAGGTRWMARRRRV